MKKSTMLNFLRAMVVCILPLGAFAQSGSVTGKVTDANNEPLIGVNVSIQGTTIGTVTDIFGVYTLNNVPNAKVTIVASFIGFNVEKTEVDLTTNAKATLNFKMIEDIEELSEVVVIGYGTQKKSDVTSAVASVSADKLAESKAINVEQAIQGRAAGVAVTANSGAPGSDIKINIRGITSINISSAPLWIVDGVPADPKSVNMNDVESLEILKDASAAAIYGANGGNGVVLVTTKKGKAGKTSVTFNMYSGSQVLPKQLEIASGPEYARMYTESQVLLKWRKKYKFSNPDTLPTYNYQDMIFRKAMQKSYDLGVSTGSDKGTFYMGVGYSSQDGILRNTAYKRLNFRVNGEYKANDWISFGENISFTQHERDGFQEWQLFGEDHTPILQALNYHSFVPPYEDSLGMAADNKNIYTNWTSSPMGNTRNPMSTIELLHRNQVINSGKATFYSVISPVKQFSVTTKLTGDFSHTAEQQFTPVFFITPSYRNSSTQIAKGQSFYKGWQFQSFFNFSTTLFDDHNITAVGGYERGYSYDEYIRATRVDLPSESEDMWYFNASRNDTALTQLPDGTGSEAAGYSFFGRLSYDYKGIFLLQGNLRKDYSSLFPKANRSGVFPSFSLGFKFSELEAVRNSVPFMNFGKIRLGYGEIGNASIPRYKHFAVAGNRQILNYDFGNTTSTSLGAAPLQFVNKAMRWESVVTYNAGLDLGFLDNRLNITADYFIRENKDMLMEQEIPGYIGYFIRDIWQENDGGSNANPIVNSGKMVNKGIELSLNWKEQKGNFTYAPYLNFSYIQTKAQDLGGRTIYRGKARGWGENLTRTMEGAQIGEYYGYIAERIFKESDCITNEDGDWVVTNQPFIDNGDGTRTYAQEKAQPGDFKFKDVNNDNIVDEKDMVAIGNPNPKVLLSFGSTFDYSTQFGSVDFAFFFQGAYGHKLFNAVKWYQYNSNGEYNWSADYVKNHYRDEIRTRENDGSRLIFEANHDTDLPRLDPKMANDNFRLSSFFMESGNYLRIKTLQLGYTLPVNVSRYAKIEKFRLYVSGTNLFTFTKYSGYDPEITGSTDALVQGLDNAAYPIAKVYTVGLNITF